MALPFRCFVIGNESLAIQCAEILLGHGHAVLGMITSDEGITRWARDRAIEVLPPGKDLGARLRERDSFDWLFSIANLTVIPDDVLALPRRGAINFHDGPLPRYAGLNAPMWAILHRQPEHGISWHFIEGGIDEGDVLAQRTFALLETDTSVVVNTRCYEAAIESFDKLSRQLAEGTEVRTPQDLSKRTYFGRFDRPAALCTIDWNAPPETISALVRALDFGPRYANPVGTAKTLTPSGDAIVLGEVTFGSAEAIDAPPGRILSVGDEGLEVVTGRGSLRFPKVTDVDGHALDGASLSKLDVMPGQTLPSFEGLAKERLSALDRSLAPTEAFWARTLASASPIELPYLEHGSSRPSQLLRTPINTPDSVSEDAMFAAVIAWASRIGTHPSFAVGYRHPSLTKAISGFEPLFAPSVPFQVEITETTRFSDLVAAVRETRGLLEPKGTYALDLIARTPNLTKIPLPLGFELVDNDEQPRLREGEPLRITFEPGAKRAHLLCDSAKVSAGHVEKIVGHLATLLAAGLHAPETQISDLPILPESELERVLHTFNATRAEYPSDKTLARLFEAQVDRTPGARALSFEGRRLTYAELDARANRLAHRLVELGVGADTLVALHLPRSPELVIGALAIWKAGGAYVPVDPSYPKDRVELYIEDSRARVVLTTSILAATLRAPHATVIALDDEAESLERQPDTRIAPRSSSSNLAYVIYTSGSTGRPKGVMIEHRHVANFFAGMDPVIPHHPPGTWLAVTSLSFDISVLELFYTLCRGFEVIVSSDEDRALVSSGKKRKSTRSIAFSLFYFASDEGEKNEDKYRLLLDGARFADDNGFLAVWTPERHFGAFGGLYPNPAVASAAIAAITRHVQIRAGSCVLPLHHPVRVAEDWALVDNLSNGRVGISFAAGWHPNDFVLRPENFANAKGAMLRDMEIVRALWRGESHTFEGPKGPVQVRTLPRPVQKELPIWLTAAGNPDTFAAAARAGAGLLTHLLGQSIEEVREKVALYRKTWKECGHPGEGHVTLMLHTFIGDDDATVRETVRQPMKDYLRSSMNLIAAHAWAFPAFKRNAKEGASFEDNFTSLSKEDSDALLDHSFERYYEASGLFGTEESALRMVERCKDAGVDEIACLIDYGIDSATVLGHLPKLAALRRASEPRPELEDDDWSIAAQLRRHGASHMQCTPSMLRMLLTNEDSRAALAGLQHVFVGGEALPGTLVAELREATRATLTNMYGPTETTIWSSTERAEVVQGTVSIGRPIANTMMYVLDAGKKPVPIGTPGELWIGGEGVARGYWERPELTAERFQLDPFARNGSGEPSRMYRTGDLVKWMPDGRIDFLGRVDHQVKIRGYRIELGEIESRLASHPDLREVVVMAREDQPGDKRLVAYYTASPGGTPDPERLRAHLKEVLPDFMVPSHFVELARFPLTPNAKIDRKQLPKPTELAASTRTEFVAARSDMEKQIAAVWMKILGLGRVGTDDNFFELGGHSLLAVQAHREIKETTGKDLSITDIFRFPTIASLANYLGGGGAESPEAGAELRTAADRAAQRRAMMNARTSNRRR